MDREEYMEDMLKRAAPVLMNSEFDEDIDLGNEINEFLEDIKGQINVRMFQNVSSMAGSSKIMDYLVVDFMRIFNKNLTVGAIGYNPQGVQQSFQVQRGQIVQFPDTFQSELSFAVR